jgi:hypothetical protein
MSTGTDIPQNHAHNDRLFGGYLLPIGISYTKITLRTSTKKVLWEEYK